MATLRFLLQQDLMREFHMRMIQFSQGLCCWPQRFDGGNSSQPARQAQDKSPSAVASSGESLSVLQRPTRACLSELNIGSVSGAADCKIIPDYSVGGAPVPLKSILKRSREGDECSDEQPVKSVRFEQNMMVHRIELRNDVKPVHPTRKCSRTYRQRVKTEARENQSSLVKANTGKNREISALGQELRKQLRSEAPSPTGKNREISVRDQELGKQLRSEAPSLTLERKRLALALL